jgi:hypothetical protein
VLGFSAFSGLLGVSGFSSEQPIGRRRSIRTRPDATKRKNLEDLIRTPSVL